MTSSMHTALRTLSQADGTERRHMDKVDEAKTKKQLQQMLSEAIAMQKKMLNEATAEDINFSAMSQNALQTAERISKDEEKLNKFII